jgi:hypothetical protein
MPRSFAFLPAPAHRGDNVVDLRQRFDARSHRQTSVCLIHNLVSALCAPYADAWVRIQDQTISVRGSGPFGIDIGLSMHGHACTLWLGGWHDEMPDVDLALEYIARAIDGRLRLKVQCTGRRPRTWIIECRADDGTWIEEAFTCGGRLWWRQPETEVYLRNAFRPASHADHWGPAA